jgi:hypothetical protein
MKTSSTCGLSYLAAAVFEGGGGEEHHHPRLIHEGRGRREKRSRGSNFFVCIDCVIARPSDLAWERASVRGAVFQCRTLDLGSSFLG